ncbi:MAG: uroporphyrinogen decarboxylase [Peptococcaceae bacterium]|nr:uroporphyrinogen decarboxylase [Peptococcaceae bacterium]
MPEEMRALYEERLGRYQATIALEKTDRMPVATGSNYFAEVYAGNTNQETIYDSEKWLLGEEAFIRDFPEVDVLRNNRIWAPLFDAVGCKTYKLPGRDLPPRTQFQFVEEEYMKADEYDVLINDPVEFMMDRFLPRVLGDVAEPGSVRSRMAFLKGGMAHMMMVQVMRNRSVYLQEKLGMPQPMTGAFLAPFDVIADAMRGLRGILLDIYRQPDKVLEACDVIVHEIANFALSTADPLKRYPIFVPTHKACFLSPKQFETFYWPSFKKTMEILIEAGYTIRAYLEGDWGHHWHHLLELPKGKVLCDIDNQGDIFKAWEVLGGHQCLAGGIPDSMFILGTPQEMRERVKLLCETVGKEGGFIINGGCNIPYDTRPENYRAMIDAIIEYGTYDKSIKPVPKAAEPGPARVEALNRQRMVTPWEQKLAELGGVTGDEDLIRRPWELLESMGYNWMWQWVM